MLRRQTNNAFPVLKCRGRVKNDKCLCFISSNAYKCGVEFIGSEPPRRHDDKAARRRCLLDLFETAIVGRVARYREHGDTSSIGHCFRQKPKVLRGEIHALRRSACDVSVGMSKAADKTRANRVAGKDDNNGDRRSRPLRGECSGSAGGDDQVNVGADDLAGQYVKAFGASAGGSIVDSNRLSRQEAVLAQALLESIAEGLHRRRLEKGDAEESSRPLICGARAERAHERRRGAYEQY